MAACSSLSRMGLAELTERTLEDGEKWEAERNID